MKARGGLWWVFGACAAVVVAAMAWITSDLLALEKAQHQARLDSAQQDAVRLALWRMDSWLSTAIALETKDLDDTVARARGVQPPPKTELVKWYVRIDETAEFDDELSALRDFRGLWQRIDRGLARLGSTVPRPMGQDQVPGFPGDRDVVEFQQRLLNNLNQTAGRTPQSAVSNDLRQSILVPLWVRQGDRELLVFLRHNTAGLDASGFVVDWGFVERSLLALVADILPRASLRPMSDDEVEADRSGSLLASVPVKLDVPRSSGAPLPLVTPSRSTLAVAWLAILVSMAAVGVALRRTSDLSERRSRFASSVTHELRTPLTTFRLYSEMLADGMVTDATQRQVYLETLKSESTRLAHLVENVLAYSRVEEGRMPLRRERIAVADLLLRIAPPLDRRAKDSGMSLSVETGDAAGAVLDVDPDVVGQVLFNLVDNACKYAASATEKTIALTAARDGARVRLRVRDHGPGIPAGRVRAAFTPFERGGRPAGDVIPGIGIGLALSRALARDLGGDLEYEAAPGGGACFVVTLPAA